MAIDCREVDVGEVETSMYGLSAEKNGRCREVAVSGGSTVSLLFVCRFRVDGRKLFAYDTFGGEIEKKSSFQKYLDTRG